MDYSKYIMDPSALHEGIANLKRRVIDVDADVQQYGLAAAAHAAECGDTTPFTLLFDAMSPSMNRPALSAWLSRFFPLAVQPARKKTAITFSVNNKRYAVYLTKGHADAAWQFTEAAATAWRSAKAESSPTAFDPFKAVMSIIKRAIKAEEEGTLKKDWSDRDTALVRSLGALVGEKVEVAPSEPTA